MTKSKLKQLSPKQKKLALLAASLVLSIFVLLIANLVYEKVYYGRVYPKLRFLDHNVGGISADDFRKLLEEQSLNLDQGLNICLEGDCLNLKSSTSTDPQELSTDLFKVNQAESFEQVFNYGRSGDFGQNIWDRVSALFWAKSFGLSIQLDRETVKAVLSDYFSYSHKAVREAGLELDANSQLTLTAESAGQEPDYDQALDQLGANLLSGDRANINLQIKNIEPKIYQANVFNINEQAEKLLTKFPITWHYQDRTWVVKANQAKSWLGLGLNRNAQVELIWDKNKLQNYLTESLNKDIAIAHRDPKFTVNSGKVYIEESAQDGLELDYEQTLLNFFTAQAQGLSDINIATRSTTSQVKGIDGLEQLEIIGIGTSTFNGSPNNRRTNIKVGASAINGVLIKAGEEFSLIKALGEIDGPAGYLPELVIKGDKTVPEYGGGLCQIGTTLFRAVVDSGLPVTARRNHSYRVSYYEPAGTDATIYDPQPDFKFMNDTGNAILLQTKITGDKAVFTFWGKRDGRKVSYTKPTIYNIVKPQPTKIIETTDLKPGEKKCTEKAHNGADAYFDYQVIYPSGEEKKVRFNSHYVPWREVCLVGVAASSTPALEVSVIE